jgi:hypothetical protein
MRPPPPTTGTSPHEPLPAPQMNHFTWYQTHQFAKPYPGETKIYTPDKVPGAYIPSTDND